MNHTLSLRRAFFCSNSSITRERRASRALSSCSLKGQSLGIPGSFSTLVLRLSPNFFASFAFFLWCSFTFLMILCFFFRGTLLLLLSETHKQKRDFWEKDLGNFQTGDCANFSISLLLLLFTIFERAWNYRSEQPRNRNETLSSFFRVLARV